MGGESRTTAPVSRSRIALAASTLFTMDTDPWQRRGPAGASGAPLSTVADTGGDEDGSPEFDDDDDRELTFSPTRQLTHRHVRRSSACVNVTMDEECNFNFAEMKC